MSELVPRAADIIANPEASDESKRIAYKIIQLSFQRETSDLSLRQFLVSFAVIAPCLLCYCIQSAIEDVASDVVHVAASTTSSVAGTAELAVRNVVPGLLNGIIGVGKMVKSYMPDIVVQIGKGVQQSSATTYVKSSHISGIIESIATSIAKTTAKSAFMASAVVYIVLSACLLCFGAVIFQVFTKNILIYGLGFGIKTE